MKKLLMMLIGIILSFSVCAQHFNNLYGHKAPSGVLDGTPISFLVTGYSTSHTPADRPWPTILQEMLNMHAGNNTAYFIFKHSVGGTPIAKWTNICGTGSHIQDAITSYIDPATQIPQGIPVPSIMLAQQSLQWAFGDCDDRYTTIENPADTALINLGVSAIQNYVNSFLDAGMEKVYMATHIYKTGNYTLNLYGERWGLAKAIEETTNLLPGPELFTVTRQLFPEGFAPDMIHPGPEVATIMAVYWYLAMAGENADLDIAQLYADSAGIDLSSTLSDNMVAFWPFNELSGNLAYDSTENHFDGQIFSAERVPGFSGNALDFDGIDDYVEVSDHNNFAPEQFSSLNTGTISFWFKYEDIYNGGTVPESLPILYFGQSSDQDPQNGLEIYLGHNNLQTKQNIYFTVHLDGGVELCFNNPTNLDAGTWYHYAVVIDSFDHRGYINGVEFNKHYNAGTDINHHGFFSTVPEGLNELLAIGYGRFSSNRFWHFNGAIDDVMIFDQVLSSVEVQNLYNEVMPSEISPADAVTVNVFPNPTTGVVNIDVGKEFGDFFVTVYNQAGQVVFYSQNQKVLSLSILSQGIYSLSIRSANQILRTRVLII